MNRLGTMALCLVVISTLGTAVRAEDADLAKLFTDRSVNGTIVISSLDGKEVFTHNDTRANTAFVPASTFKILNTLIALDEGVVADENTVIKWDGKDKGMPSWNRDQTLETAFKTSCIWYFQELARKIGTAKYEERLAEASYGNAKPGPELTTFWLQGDLKISAVGETEFLKKVYRKELPYKPASYDILRKIMITEQTPKYTIRAKTGWAQKTTPQIGWFVGYVESGDKVWFFATNMDMTRPEDIRYR